MRKISVSKLVMATGLGLTLVLTGCAKKRLTTGSVPSSLRKPVGQMSKNELHSANKYWSSRYKKAPKNKEVGMKFATTLRTMGRNDQALAVMQQVAIHHPSDRQVIGAYGKALASAGKFQNALETIQRAQTPDNPDWKLYSAEGTIYDQLGKPKLARSRYRKALDIQPGDPSILSNLGMSYLLTGDLRSSETYLRQAVVRPKADNRVRQNLALVIGLQGRFKEAENVAAGNLSKQDAAANIAFLKQMLAEQNAWEELKDKK
ncbi:MAG: tetratricopeptide repeat protein [Rhizobiaceae bacterium]